MTTILSQIFVTILTSSALQAEPVGGPKGFSFLPPEPCVLNYIFFPAPRGWNFNYARIEGSRTFAFMQPRPAENASVYVRFTDDPDGREFDSFQNVMLDLVQAGKAEHLDLSVLDPAAEKRDIFFIRMPNVDEYLVLYRYPNQKDLLQIKIVFSPPLSAARLSAEEQAQLRALTLAFIRNIRKIEVLRTSPD